MQETLDRTEIIQALYQHLKKFITKTNSKAIKEHGAEVGHLLEIKIEETSSKNCASFIVARVPLRKSIRIRRGVFVAHISDIIYIQSRNPGEEAKYPKYSLSYIDWTDPQLTEKLEQAITSWL